MAVESSATVSAAMHLMIMVRLLRFLHWYKATVQSMHHAPVRGNARRPSPTRLTTLVFDAWVIGTRPPSDGPSRSVSADGEVATYPPIVASPLGVVRDADANFAGRPFTWRPES